MGDARSGARFRPIIRVFISSTFSDLKLERDALQKRVFPGLEQRCQKDGFQFQAIDLRWGVSTEAGLDHRTMRICLDELRRSQEISPEPNFLILLGNRYGWRPLPEAVSREEFEQFVSAAKSGGKNHQPILGSQGKSAEQIVREWYRCDENVLLSPPSSGPDRAPLNYILQPRTQKLDDGRDYSRTKDPQPKDTQAWLDVQQVLWSVINAAFPQDQFARRFDQIDWPQHIADVHDKDHPKRAVPQIVRIHGSATEQEIWCGALSVPNAGQHVLAFFREIDPQPRAEDASLTGEFFDLVAGEIDPNAQAAQRDLKTQIRKRLGSNAVDLPATQLSLQVDPSGKRTAAPSTGHLKVLCDEVETRLAAIIDRQIKEYWRETRSAGEASGELSALQRTARELEIERDEHLRFGLERGPKESFVGRRDQLERIRAYVENESPWPLVIHGASGCGKTALLARAVQEMPSENKPIVRFIGVTPRSSDLRSLLSSLCQELRQRNPIAGLLPTDVRELIQELPQHFRAATPQQPVILFLDALDQLSDADNGRQLFWIPLGPLPSHVKLIVSCLSDRNERDPVGQPYFALQQRKLPANNLLMLDALSRDEARTLLLDRWLPAAGRTVNKAQRRLIEQRLESEPCRQPLYLKLLFEEVKLWPSYAIPEPPGEGVPALLGQLCARLSQPENHGELAVRFVLGYLAAARHGLGEMEILEVLFADPDYKRELDEASKRNNHSLPTDPPRIPISIWSRLRSDLAPYLTERAAPGGSVLTLYHRQVAEWIKGRYVDGSAWNPHSRLATFFANQDYFLESLEEQRARAKRLPPTPRPANIRKVDELPWQLLEVARLFGKNDPKSPHWDTVADLFTDLHFLEAKAEAAE